MNIDQDNNTIRKRSLSQSSNSSNSKRSCSVDSPSPIDNNNNSTTSNNLINSISSLGCSNLNLMEDLNDDKKQLEFEESVLKTTTSSSSTTTSATTIDSDSISPTPEQIDDDELNTTIMASSTTSSIEKDLADYESSLPSYASLASITTTSSKPDGTTQIQIIDELKNEQLATGDTWYLVSREWYRKWETACSGIAESKEDDTGLSMDDIGPVDNARLTDQHGELKRNMIDGVTVTVLPRACWELLCSWYVYIFFLSNSIELYGLYANLEFYFLGMVIQGVLFQDRSCRRKLIIRNESSSTHLPSNFNNYYLPFPQLDPDLHHLSFHYLQDAN